MPVNSRLKAIKIIDEMKTLKGMHKQRIPELSCARKVNC